jgi:hypothetical protein
MASEPVTRSVPTPPPLTQVQPFQVWLARLGLSGKILAIGGLVGVIAVFLPLVSIQMQSSAFFGGRGGVSVPAVNVSQTVMVVRDFRGMLCLLGYLAVLAFSYVLYMPVGLNAKQFGWAAVGVGGGIALLALWLVLGTLGGSGSLGGFGGSLSVSVGSGAILNLLAAAAVATGGVLKAREEKLF